MSGTVSQRRVRHHQRLRCEGRAHGSAYGTNEADQVVGCVSDDPAERPARRPFLYSDGQMRDLNGLVAPGSGWS